MAWQSPGREIEARVAEWLQREGATFIQNEHVAPAKGKAPGGAVSARPDFRVIKPFPFLIEVVGQLPARGIARRMGKRLLAGRIVLAERFGRRLPLICIVPDLHYGEPWTQIPFVDASFPVSGLPPLLELPKLVRLDPEVQLVLERGNPGVPELSDPDDIVSKWRRSLTLEDLAKGGPYTRGTLAARLHAEITSSRTSSTSPPFPKTLERWRVGVSMGSRNSPGREYDKLIMQLSRVRQAIQDEVVRHLGGKVTGVKLQLDRSARQVVGNVAVWESEKRRRAAIRVIVSGDLGTVDKVRELLAEAWLIRALSPSGVDDLIVVLGMGRSLEPVATLLGPRHRPNLPNARFINGIESAGWKVFSWDFDQEEPSYIEYLALAGRHGYDD